MWYARIVSKQSSKWHKWTGIQNSNAGTTWNFSEKAGLIYSVRFSADMTRRTNGKAPIETEPEKMYS